MGDGLGIPRSADDITPAWLTGALRADGVLRDGEVVSVTSETLSQGVGFLGQVLRLEPVYGGDATGAPSTIIAKIPTLDPGGRQIAAMYGMYERELQFYRHMAADMTMRVPRCYYGDGDPGAVAYILLLEDLAPTGTLGDQVVGCGLPEARVALKRLAEHHAKWWQHPALETTPWLGVGVDLVRGSIEQAYAPSVEPFLHLFGDSFSPDVRAVIPTLGGATLRMLESFDDGPFTIAHGDYRADNMFFGHPGSDYDVAVIDWQSPNKGWAAYDLSYFICGSFATNLRKQHEAVLRDEYFAALSAAGVTGYNRQRFDDDYARSLLAYLALFVINGATLDPSNDRGRELFRAIFERLDGALADANSLSYLG
jgi:hypothetical protein